MVNIPKASASIRIDGTLDEAVWQQAQRFQLKYESYPGNNSPARHLTTCLILHSDATLYVGFIAEESDTASIRAQFRDRDSIDGQDLVGIVLDTFNDRRRGFMFAVSARGVQADAVITSGEETIGAKAGDASWDAVWTAAASADAQGYYVEMAIPFNQLNFSSGKEPVQWGFDAFRSRPRDADVRYRYIALNRDETTYLPQLAEIRGFAGISPGRDLELLPTVTAIDSSFSDSSRDSAAGLSCRWGLSNNLTLSGTLNPDFSQVEADAAQLDVNERFALFFEEKRPFFIEGADIYDTPLNLVHTRSISDPAWGVKANGKHRNSTFAFFSSQDQQTTLLLPGNEGSRNVLLGFRNQATALRLRQDIGRSSYVGGLITDRRADAYGNTVAAVDSFLTLTDSDILQIQLAGSQTDYPDEIAFGNPVRGDALQAEYLHRTNKVFLRVRWRDMDEDFRSDMGFIPQVGVKELLVTGKYDIWPSEKSLLTRFQVGNTWSRLADSSGLQRERLIPWINFWGPSDSFFSYWLEADRQRSGAQTFDVLQHVLFYRMRFGSRAFMRIWVQGGSGVDFVNSRKADAMTAYWRLDVNLSERLQVNTNYTLRRQGLGRERIFLANQLDIRGELHLNRRLLIRTIAQFTDIRRNPALYHKTVIEHERDLATQILLSYRINARTVFFVGYSDLWEEDGFGTLKRQGRTLFAKIGYSLFL